MNGDGQITLADRTIIGSPHPDFTGGLDVGLYRGAWDLTATVFGIVRQRHLREPEGVLRLPRILDERSEGPALELVDTGEPEREVPAARCQRHV